MDFKISYKERNIAMISFIFFLLIWPSISDLAYGLFYKIGLEFEKFYLDFSLWILLIIAFGKHIIKNTLVKQYIYYFTFTLIAIVSWTVTDFYTFDFSKLAILIAYIMPTYLLGSMKGDYKFIEDKLYKISLLALALNLIYLYYYMSTGRTLDSDNMNLAYNILPLTCIIFNRAIDSPILKNYILAALSVLALIGLGTRGPILCLGTFILLKFIKKQGFNKFVIKLIILSTVLFTLLSSDIFKYKMYEYRNNIVSMGLSARIIDMAIDSNLRSDNGRNIIEYTLEQEVTEENLFVGHGIFSDREFTRGLIDYENYSVYGDEGTYAHNLLLELKVDYGVIWGYIIFIYLIYVFFRTFLSLESDKCYIFLLFLTCGFIKLFVSGSYLESNLFFLLLGYSHYFLAKKSKEKNISNI